MNQQHLKQGRKINREAIFALAWLVLLALPAVAAYVEEVPLLWKVIFTFAFIVYLWFYSWGVLYGEPATESTASNRNNAIQEAKVAASIVLVQSVLVALMYPAAGIWIAFFLPFLVASLLYSVRFKLALTLAITAVIVMFLLAAQFSLETWHFWVCVGNALSCGGITLGRLSEIQKEQSQALKQAQLQQRERDLISRDVHDILGHSLTTLVLKAEVARRLIDADPAAAKSEMDEVITLGRGALADVRATVHHLRQPTLESQLEATKTVFNAANIALEVSGSVDQVKPIYTDLFAWVLREASTNIVRHAQASRAELDFAEKRLVISDNGRGCPAEVLTDTSGSGIKGMQARVQAAGGTLKFMDVADQPGTGPGCRIEVVMP